MSDEKIEKSDWVSLLKQWVIAIILIPFVVVGYNYFRTGEIYWDDQPRKPKTESESSSTEESWEFEPEKRDEREVEQPKRQDEGGTFSIRVEEVGFLGDYEIDQYTVRIERTSDLYGNYVYDSGQEKVRTSGFFGSATDFYVRESGYYDVEYSGTTSDGRTAFRFGYSNVKHVGYTEATFYTSEDYSPSITHY